MKLWNNYYLRQATEILSRHATMDDAVEVMNSTFPFRVTKPALRRAFSRHIGHPPSAYLGQALQEGQPPHLRLVEEEPEPTTDRRPWSRIPAPSPKASPSVSVEGEEDPPEEEPGNRRRQTLEAIEKFKPLFAVIRKGPVSFRSLCDKLDLSPTKTERLIKEAKEAGVEVSVVHNHVGIDNEPPPHVQDTHIAPVVGERQQIAVISDTHLGSKYCMRPQLKDFIHYAYSQGVRTILHAGDVLDGNYHHSVFELTHSGLEDQTMDLIETLPQLEGLTYHGITGNHDETFWKKTGVNVGRVIQAHFQDAGRNDFYFYGDRDAFLQVHGIVVHLWHPTGSGAYARCYDEQTEILTENGWKFFKDLEESERVATLTPEHTVSWEQPTEYQTYDYKGHMYRIQSRFVDLLVTPEHDLFLAEQPHPVGPRNFERVKVEAAAERWATKWNGRWRAKKDARPQVGRKPETFTVPALGKRHNKPVPIRPLLRLMGYFVAEGCIQVGRSGHPCGRVTFSQYREVNPGVHADMAACVRAVGLSPYEGERVVDVSSRELAAVLSECGEGSENKRIPRWVMELDASLLSELFDAYLLGDGSFDECGHFSAQTKSKQLADDLQELALRLGISAAVRPCRGLWAVSFNRLKNEPRIDTPIERIPDWEGKVYDVTVPNHVIYVRRNGKACWSGNSYHPQKKVESYMALKPQLLLCGHWHQYVHIFERGVHAIACPTFQGSMSRFSRSLKGSQAQGGLLLSWDLTEHGTIRNFILEKRTYYERERPIRVHNHIDGKPIAPAVTRPTAVSAVDPQNYPSKP